MHCLALPLLIALLPTVTVLSLQQEAFHFWMVVAVIPISSYALFFGCKKHHNFSIVGIGIIGLTCLILAVLFGESHLGEVGEKLITVIGALLLSSSHYQNFTLCHRLNCPCPNDQNN